MSKKIKYLHKSFSRGIISPNLITRNNITQYDEGARDLYNILVGRQGEAFKRAGTFHAVNTTSPPVRIIPFYSSDEAYLIVMSEGKVVSNGVTPNISVVNVTNLKTNKVTSDIEAGEFPGLTPCNVNSNVKSFDVYEGYYIKDSESFNKDEITALDYTQLGNTLIFTSAKFAPFYIRKERDRFVFYRGAFDLIINGDSSEKIDEKALYSIPYSFYGLGLHIVSASKLGGNIRFEGYVTPKSNYDNSALSSLTDEYWENRAFLVSTITTDTNTSKILGGIISEFKVVSQGSKPSKYRVRGFIEAESKSAVTDFNTAQTNLFLSDWSAVLTFPSSVCIFENRVIYGGHKTYPSKVWFSAQPGKIRVQIGTKEEITVATSTTAEIRTRKPIYVNTFYDQLDMFDKESEILGSIPLQTSSPGNYFINDDKGFFIHWVRAGENLFIGTDQGIFTSQGTRSDGAAIPFNTGFVKSIEHPVKRILPIVVEESLYFISEDNSLQSLIYDRSRNGFKVVNIDNYIRELITDPSNVEYTTRNVTLRVYAPVDVSATNCQVKARTDSAINMTSNTTLNVSTIGVNISSTPGTTGRRSDSTYATTLMVGVPFKNVITATNLTTQEEFKILCNGKSLYETSVSNLFDLSDTKEDALIKGIFTKRKTLPDGTGKKLSLSPDQIFFGGSLTLESNTIESRRLNRSSGGRYRSRTDYTYSYYSTLKTTYLVRKDTLKKDISFTNVQTRDSVGYREVLTSSVDIDLSKVIPQRTFGTPTTILATPAQTNINSWVNGEISSGYLGCPTSLSNPRLCFFSITPSTNVTPMIRIGFNENKTKVNLVATGFRVTNASNLVVSEGLIPDLTTVTSTTHFSTRNVSHTNNYFDVAALNLVHTYPTTYSIQLNKVVSGNTVTVGDVIKVTLKSGVIVTDNLDVPYSGDYDVYSGSKTFGHYALDYYDGESIGVLTGDTFLLTSGYSRSNLSLSSFYTNYVNGKLSSMNILLGDASEISDPNDSSTPISTLTTVRSVTTVQVPIFNSNTKLLYDWTLRTLFIFRKNLPYLALTMDKQTQVLGWSRGQVDMQDPIFVQKRPYDPPNTVPTIFGVTPNGIEAFSYHILNGKENYVDNLPNGLDNHIILDTKDELSLRSPALYDKLKSRLGYADTDIISIASTVSTIFSGAFIKLKTKDIEVTNVDSIVIGKNYEAKLVTYPPHYQSKGSGYILGRNYGISNLIFNAINVKDFYLNGSPARLDVYDEQRREDYGSVMIRAIVDADQSYDPIVKIKVYNPYPFVIGGYIMEIGASE